MNPDHRIDALAAAFAGVAAGIGSTAVQIVLWWIASVDVAAVLLRDARLTAAIVMGPAVLVPPVSFNLGFEWKVMLLATVVHFLLSIAYGLLLAPWLTGLGLRKALVAGAVFGALLYAVNMYGFTRIFPWFAATRDWITITAHISFGVVAAYAYKQWTRPGVVQPSRKP